MFDAEAIIAEAQKSAELQNAGESQPPAQAEEPASQPSDKPQEDVSKKSDEELTPEQLEKREQNRKSHENSKLARLRRQNREFAEQLKQMQSQMQQLTKAQVPQSYVKREDSGKPIKPNVGDYSSYMEYEDAKDSYHEALSDWKLEQKLTPKEQPQESPDQSSALQKINTQRLELAKLAPDYEKLVTDHADFFEDIPPSLQQAFIAAENAPLALYAFMKEGELDELEELSPDALAYAIRKAEHRGRSYLEQPKKATSAPPPLEPLKGTGKAQKDLSDLSVEELMRKFNK